MQKIMFNDRYGLTQAVLEGRKTQTRRVIKMNDAYERGNDEYWSAEDIRNWNNSFTSRILNAKKEEKEKCFEYLLSHPRYKIGDIVAVAQSYGTISESMSHGPSTEKALFYCDIMKSCYPKEEIPRDVEDIAAWNNKMFVKPELMPHQIRITGIKVERLQDISDKDCLKEGIVTIEPRINGGTKSYYPCQYLKDCADKVGWGRVFDTPREAYADLIDKVSGKGTWEKNPYVFVYDFELVK